MLIVEAVEKTDTKSTFGPFTKRENAERLAHELALQGIYVTVRVREEGDE